MAGRKTGGTEVVLSLRGAPDSRRVSAHAVVLAFNAETGAAQAQEPGPRLRRILYYFFVKMKFSSIFARVFSMCVQ